MFSGIGAPETAMPEWDWLWHAEIEPFPSAVMAARHPGSINLGDVSAPDFAERAIDAGRPDVIVFGSPCQSFSVAGKRLGLDDPRGNLALVALGVVERVRPRWLVFENVPGLLSSGGGDDFAAFLSVMGQCGYFGAGRVLDARYFGVPQRRRRVFFVGHLGDWRSAAAVLFEPASLRGDHAPGKEAREGTAPTLSARTRGGGGLGTDFDCDGGLVASTGDISHCLNAGGMGRQDYETETLVTHTLRGDGFDASENGTGRGTPLVPVALQYGNAQGGKSQGGVGVGEPGGPMYTLDSQGPTHGVAVGSVVRRLTATECHRLQGFPDDHCAIVYRGKPAADGPMYKALGNSMAVPCVRWILSRLEAVDAQ